MSRTRKGKNGKVPKMTEEQYAEYVMAMKDETPVQSYRELAAGRSVPHIGEKKRRT